MFIRASAVLFSVAAFAGVATAIPSGLEVRNGYGGGSSQCDTGSLQCCNSVQNSNSAYIATLFGTLGIPMPASDTQVGVTCSPVTVSGTGSGSSCTEQTVCCNGNTFEGGVVTGCSPITINA